MVLADSRVAVYKKNYYDFISCIFCEIGCPSSYELGSRNENAGAVFCIQCRGCFFCENDIAWHFDASMCLVWILSC